MMRQPDRHDPSMLPGHSASALAAPTSHGSGSWGSSKSNTCVIWYKFMPYLCQHHKKSQEIRPSRAMHNPSKSRPYSQERSNKPSAPHAMPLVPLKSKSKAFSASVKASSSSTEHCSSLGRVTPSSYEELAAGLGMHQRWENIGQMTQPAKKPCKASVTIHMIYMWHINTYHMWLFRFLTRTRTCNATSCWHPLAQCQ